MLFAQICVSTSSLAQKLESEGTVVPKKDTMTKYN
jgi:hypothetical protein